jgi:IS605 OrfB family transposase
VAFWYTVWMSSYRPTAVRVLRLRVKDKHAPWLSGLAREVNTVFNYCNELSVKVFEREQRFLSGFEFWPFLKGVTRGDCALHLPVQAVQEIADLNVCVPRAQRGADEKNKPPVDSILDRSVPSLGIDLGLKSFAAFSDDAMPPIDAERFYRDLEPALARAQRARHRQRTRAIHAKIANRRKDFLHKLSTRLVTGHGAVFVGKVNASALTKTRQAKSVLDAGWSAFRTMLPYKCADAGVWFEEVDEAFSTQTCSVCNSRTGPKGRQGLGMRGWQCTVCGAIHDRDVNAAHNILAAGHRRLAEGNLVP